VFIAVEKRDFGTVLSPFYWPITVQDTRSATEIIEEMATITYGHHCTGAGKTAEIGVAFSLKFILSKIDNISTNATVLHWFSLKIFFPMIVMEKNIEGANIAGGTSKNEAALYV
jgi:hypothetical protein